jgi:hypothetical protein
MANTLNTISQVKSKLKCPSFPKTSVFTKKLTLTKDDLPTFYLFQNELVLMSLSKVWIK